MTSLMYKRVCEGKNGRYAVVGYENGRGFRALVYEEVCGKDHVTHMSHLTLDYTKAERAFERFVKLYIK